MNRGSIGSINVAVHHTIWVPCRWLDAWSDPVAGVSAFSSCIHTCNLFGDGDWRLIVADADKKLKVRPRSACSQHTLINHHIKFLLCCSKQSPNLALCC